MRGCIDFGTMGTQAHKVLVQVRRGVTAAYEAAGAAMSVF